MDEVALDRRHCAGFEVTSLSTGKGSDPGSNVGRPCNGRLNAAQSAPLPPQGQVRAEGAACVFGPATHGCIEQRLVDANACTCQCAHISDQICWFDR